MAIPPDTKTREDMGKRAEVVFNEVIRPRLHGAADTDYVLIDVESGDFEIDADEMVASHRLLTRHPNAMVWMRRVGSSAGRRYGGHRHSIKP